MLLVDTFVGLVVYIDNLEFRYSNEDTIDFCEECYNDKEINIPNREILEKELINLNIAWMCDKCECEIDDFSYRWTRPYHNYDLCMECYEKEEDNSSYSMATTNSGFNFLIEGYYPMDIDSSDESSDIDPFTIRQENISTSDSDIESINTENRDTIQDGEIITDNDMYLTDEQVLRKV